MTALCTFELGGLLFGVPVEQVQEVVLVPAVAPVPLADPVVRGLLNLRGRILVALDLAQRLGLERRGGGDLAVVLRAGDEDAALMVDEIGDVVEARGQTLEDAPDTLAANVRELIEGVQLREGRLLLLLAVERAIGATAQDTKEGPECRNP